MSSVMDKILRLAADHRRAEAVAAHEQRVLAEAAVAVTNTLQAQQAIQLIAREIQQQAHARIAGVVTRCLSVVFEEPYEFCITYVARRGATEAVITFVRNGVAVDPLTAAGGGVVDVAAFALRLAALILSRPPVRRVLVMDEPFRFVSRQYRSRVRALLSALAVEMNVQFIIVTHFEDLAGIGTTVIFGG